jgi:cell division transport system permease protein
MKIRTLRYIIKEGAVNSYRNTLMSLASVITVIVTLMLFGFILLVAYNIEINLNTLKEQPQLEAFCFEELDDTQVQSVEDEIKNDVRIASFEKVSKQQAMEKMRERLGKDEAAMFEGYGNSIFSVSFIIKLKDNTQSADVVKALELITGVEKVSYSQYVVDVISKVSYWAKFIISIMIVIFLVVSVFIISNTIKLTVYARRREINIMKYVGATDWFIRWPFVVEGVIIGITGAIFAFILSAYGYNAIEGKFTNDILTLQTDFLKMVKIRDIWYQLIISYLVIGIVVGSIGSFLSIRKHLRV